MKTKFVLLSLVLSGLLFQSAASARPDSRARKSPAEFFEAWDLNQDQRVDELELFSALKALEQRRLSWLARLEERDAKKAESIHARRDVQRDDPMLGTPARAAVFMVANFDEDGDWALDRKEVGQAFSALRKWRGAAQS